MRSYQLIILSVLIGLFPYSCEQGSLKVGQASSEQRFSDNLTAKSYYSGFPLAHDTYNAISAASDNKIYYILSSQSIDKGGRMYVYDPQTNKARFVVDLTEACGEKGKNAIPQGKSHVRFYESQGKLYFATHVGYYEMINGRERMPEHVPE